MLQWRDFPVIRHSYLFSIISEKRIKNKGRRPQLSRKGLIGKN